MQHEQGQIIKQEP